MSWVLLLLKNQNSCQTPENIDAQSDYAYRKGSSSRIKWKHRCRGISLPQQQPNLCLPWLALLKSVDSRADYKIPPAALTCSFSALFCIFKLMFLSPSHPSGISLLCWPSWPFWGCWTAWCCCQFSCPWWAPQPKSPQWTTPAACLRLPPNHRCRHRWHTTATTRGTTTSGRPDSRLFRNRRTPSITRRWPPRRLAGRRIISTVTEACT